MLDFIYRISLNNVPPWIRAATAAKDAKDWSLPSFGSHLNPISTRGGRLCPPYTGVLGWLKFAMAALINPQYVLSAPIFLECRSAPAPYQKKEWHSHIAPFEKREWHSLIALSWKECTLLSLFFCNFFKDFFLTSILELVIYKKFYVKLKVPLLSKIYKPQEWWKTSLFSEK